MRCLCLLTVLALSACGSTPKTPTVVKPTVDAARRANGLAVHTVSRLGSGVVAIHLRLPAGSLDETPDDAGSAHGAARWVLGDENRGLMEAVRRIGGVARAWTTRVATSFEIVVAADQAGEALVLLGKALTEAKVDARAWAAMLPRLDAEQREVRLSDHRRAIEVSVADLFIKHPFARAPLPDSVALRRLKSTRIDQFIERRYRPDGAVLVLTGELDKDVDGQIERAFAGWKGVAATVQRPPVTSPGELNVRVVGTRSTRATIALTFLADGLAPEAAATLDLMGAAVSMRVEAALRRIGVTTTPQAIVSAPTGAGFVSVLAEVPAAKVDAAWQTMVPAIVREAGAPWSDAQFQALKAQVDRLADTLDGSLEGEARRLAASHARWPGQTGDPWRTGLAMAGPADLADAERRLLRLERASAVIIAPDAIRTDDDGPWLQSLTEQAARLARPDGGLAAGRHAVAEGLEVVVHPMPGARQVGIAVWLAGGARAVRPLHAGLAALVARGLATPAAGEPAIDVRVEPDGLLLSCEVPGAEVDAALRALGRRVRGLAWTPAEVEAARIAPARDLEALLARTTGVDLLGTPESRQRLVPATVRRWYAANVREAPMTLVLAGGVDRRALAGLETRFGRRRPARPAKARPVKAGTLSLPIDGRRGRIARRWPAVGDQRAAMALAFATLLAPDSATRAALSGLGARVDARVGARTATLYLDAPARRFSAAETALTKGLDTLRTLPIDGDLLAQVRARQAAQLAVRLRRPGVRARWLLEHARAGAPYTGPDALEAWQRALDAVGPKAVAQAARDGMSRAKQITVRLSPQSPTKGRR